MRVKCIKPCDGMAIGEIGEFKSLRTSGNLAIFRVKLLNGVTVNVPASCCKILDTETVEA